jgi:hypothetical protein
MGPLAICPSVREVCLPFEEEGEEGEGEELFLLDFFFRLIESKDKRSVNNNPFYAM